MVSLVPHRARGAFFLEKWYVDTLLPDGSVLMLYLAWMRLFGVRLGRLSAQFFTADGGVIEAGAPVGRFEGTADGLVFGPARIEDGLLEWRLDALSGRLRFAPRHEPVVLLEPFLAEGGRSLHWTVEIPDADVEGALRWPGGGREVAGRGYRDRVWLDFAPWRFPIEELRWGRAAAGPHAATWVFARGPGGAVAAGWRDGKVVAAEEPPLSGARTLLDADVSSVGALRLGWMRPLLRRLGGDPHEVKWAAAALLGDERGRAVHERVRFRPRGDA